MSDATPEIEIPAGFDSPRFLAEGAFGHVYAAVAPGGEPVALKVLAERWLASPQAVWRFTEEYRRLASLDHPAFPRALGDGVDAAGRPYYAMALVAGRSPTPADGPAAVEAVLKALAAALCHLHGRGLVHGDLKPANVLVEATGHVYLIDPGGMMPIGRRRQAIEGTLEYLAPEAFRRADVAPAADWYALGVLGYELLAGHLPFTGSPGELLRGHLLEQPPALTSDLAAATPGPSEAIMALLAKEPAARMRALPAILAGWGIEALPVALRLLSDAWVERPALAAAWTSPATLLLVEGPAGAGKTRTLDAWRVQAELAGRCWTSASARAIAGAAPRILVRQWLGVLAEAPDEVLASWLAERTPAVWQDLEPAARKGAVAQLVGRVYARALAANPGLIVAIDDFELLDADDRLLLGNLAERVGSGRWCLGVTTNVLASKAIALEGWSADELATLVTARLGQVPPAGLLALLAELRVDTPGTLDALLERWVAVGTLAATSPAGWVLDVARARADGLAGTELARRWVDVFNALPPAARALGEVAVQAVALGGLDASSLGRVAGVAPEDRGVALDALVAGGLLVEEAGLYRLAQPVLAPALGLDATETKTIRRATALAEAVTAGVERAELSLERLFPAAELALAGDRPPFAVALAVEACQRGLAQGAFAAVHPLAERTLARFGDDGSLTADDRRVLLFTRAEAGRQLDRLAEATADYLAAVPLAEAAGDDALAAAALLGYAKCAQAAGDYPAAALGAERAEAAAARTGATALEVRAALTRARLALFSGAGSAAALAHCERAVARARVGESAAMLAAALDLHGTLAVQQDVANADWAIAEIREAVALNQAIANPLGLGSALDGLGNALLSLGRLGEARQAFTQYAEVARLAGTMTAALSADMNQALVLAELGEGKEALALATDVAARAARAGRKFVRAIALATLAQAQWRTAWPAEAAAALAEALDLTLAIGNKLAQEHVRLVTLDYALALGDVAAADEQLKLLDGLVAQTDHAEARTRLAVGRAVLALLRQEPDALERAEACLGSGPPETMFAARLVAGRAALVEARRLELATQPEAGRAVAGRAAAHFEAALAIARGWAAPWHEAEVLVGRGRATGDSRDFQAVLALAGTPNLYARAAACWALLDAGDHPEREPLATLLAALAPLPAAARAGLLGAWQLPAENVLAGAAHVRGDAGVITTSDLAHWHDWIAQATHEEAIQQRLLAALLALVRADRGYLLSYDQGRLCQAVIEGVDYDAEIAQGFSASVAEEAFFGGLPVYEVDAGASARWASSSSVMALSLKTVLALPYGTPDELMGVAYVDRQAIEPLLSGPDVAALKLLVDFAAFRVDAERKQRTANMALAEARREGELGFALAECQALGERRRLLLAACCEASGAARAFWLARDPDGSWRALESADDEGGAPSFDTTRISQSTLAEVLRRDAPVWHFDADVAEGWVPGASVQALGLTTVWCWPVGQDAVIYADGHSAGQGEPDVVMAALDRLLRRAIKAYGLAARGTG